jgi:hypothetical protein
LSNTSAFTCPWGNAGSTLKGNRLSVPSQPLRPISKSEFLGAAGFCQIWIPNYSLLAKLLCEATKEGEWENLEWKEKQEKAFKEIKGLSPMPCSRPAGCDEAPFPVCP